MLGSIFFFPVNKPQNGLFKINLNGMNIYYNDQKEKIMHRIGIMLFLFYFVLQITHFWIL